MAAVLFVQIVALVTICLYIKDVTSSSCLTNSDDFNFPKNIRSELYRGQQAFTVSMLDVINKGTPNNNIFFSPYSTYHALLLAYFGARNQTEAQLTQALHLEWAQNKNHVRQAYRFEKAQRAMRDVGDSVVFASADRIYFSNGVDLHECMHDLFYEELERLDFENDPEGSRILINNWIANVTRNEIPEVLTPGDIESDTNLVLANAAYFKGEWESKFDPEKTTRDIFHSSTSNRTLVQMMHKRGNYNLAIDERLHAHVLEMPYAGGEENPISMIIILPPFTPNGLDEVLKNLNPDTLSMALKESMGREIDVSLPKFKFEQKLELLPVLNKIGITDLFISNSDLSGFSTKRKLSLGDAKHVAKIQVDEEGSTAAAATVLFSFRSARPVEPTKFECNHPFLFLIYDHKTEAILFTGIYRDPNAQ